MSQADNALRETADPFGRRVVLLDRIWTEKILPIHPELRGFRTDVVLTVAIPDHHEADTQPDRIRYFSKARGPSNWLLVVVSYEQVPARVITAFGHRKDPSLWKP